MKKILNIFILAAMAAGAFTSCNEYEGPVCPSIFEIKPDTVDLTQYTAPLDSFCKKNFLQTYNLDFKYKMEDVSSDVNKNLTPASYDKCEQMAVLTKYLWYDVYKFNVGESVDDGHEFLKHNSVRIIHLIGSKNINPVLNTENLGTASGGIKITLYKSNYLNPYNLAEANKFFFATMHHEFGHQLCSRYVVPLEYRQLSAGFYDPLGWQNTCDSVALGDGFITDYSRNMYEDDFVEMFSKYITYTPMEWQARLETAKWQWEEVTYDSGSNGWTEFEKMERRVRNGLADIDSVGYRRRDASTSNKLVIVRKVIKREVTEKESDYAHAIAGGNGEIQYILKDEGKTGTDLILKKLDMLKDWLATNYQIDLEKVHQAVLTRSYVTDENGEFVRDSKGQFVNRLVQPYKGYPTLVDYLVENMREYRSIDEFDFIK